jgi:hypothetical protein
MKAMIYQALDWFDAQGTLLDVAMLWVLAMVIGLTWRTRR